MVEFVLSNAIPFLTLLKWLSLALTSALTSRCLCPGDDWTSLLGRLVGIADSLSSPAFPSLAPHSVWLTAPPSFHLLGHILKAISILSLPLISYIQTIRKSSCLCLPQGPRIWPFLTPPQLPPPTSAGTVAATSLPVPCFYPYP